MHEHGDRESTGLDGGEAHEIDPTALSVAATTAGGGFGVAGLEPVPRPWTPAAAMEPLPPLAPPPARPGAGLTMRAGSAQRRGPGPMTTVVSIAVLIAAAVVIVVLVLTVGR
jgi:hypothetical protein